MSDAQSQPEAAGQPAPAATPASAPAPPVADPVPDATPGATPEPAVSPTVAFYRAMVSRVSAFLRDPKSKLTGPNRLIAELLDRRGVPICSQANAAKIAAWEKEWQRLQAIVDSHDYDAATRAFTAQQNTLADKTTTPEESGKNQVMSRAALEEKFTLTRESAKQSQQRLFAQNIETARDVSAIAAQILAEHVVTLEASEKSRFELYGLPYHGSELVNAVQKARSAILGRVQAGTGMAPPSQLMAWLIL